MFMRTMTAIAVLTGLSAALTAQGQTPPPPPSQEQLQKLRQEKLAKEVFTKANWITDYDKVRSEAKATSKPIFAYFTRSYSR